MSKKQKTEEKVVNQKTFSKQKFYTTRDASNVYLFSLILPYVFTLIYILILSSVAINSGFMTSEDNVSVMYEQIWFTIPYYILSELVLLGIYFFYHQSKKISLSATKISFKKANPWTVLLCAFAGILCVMGFMCLVEGSLGQLFKGWGLVSEETSVSLPLSDFGWLILNFLLVGILPAVCEELLFRGVIFKGLKSKFSATAAIFLSAFLFAIMHGNIQQLVYPFFMGVVMAVIMECTNNLLYTIIFHAFNNCTSLTISYLIENNLISLNFSASWFSSWWGVLIGIALVLLTLAVLFVMWKFYLKKHQKLEEPEAPAEVDSGKMVGKMPLTLVFGIVIAVVIFVINTIPLE